MRIILNYSNLVFFYLIVMFVRCSDCSDDERWGFLGNENVGIYTIDYIDIISVNDSLFLEILGNTIKGDMFDNVDLEIERYDSSIKFTLYADIYKFNGCGIMPPTALNPHTNIDLLPPFSLGSLRLIANQPFGLDTLGIVTVIP